MRNLLEHPDIRVDWDRVERTARNYRVAPMVAAGLKEIRAEAPDCVSDEICVRLRRLPIRRIDRFFLHLIRRFPEEVCLGHAVIVGLDFFRTRPCRLNDLPLAFVNYLKDRWELASPRQVQGHLVEETLWGLQVELGRLSTRLREILGLRKASPARIAGAICRGRQAWYPQMDADNADGSATDLKPRITRIQRIEATAA